MLKRQKQVEDFHRAVDHPVGDYTKPAIQDAILRMRLIREECDELLGAIARDDLVEVINRMCDLKYVIHGAAVAFGIDLEPFEDEVHRTNMAKTTGPIREDGKQLKPPGWEPPKIREILTDLTA